MDSFDTLEVSSSGRPKLYPNEVTFVMESSARITGALDEKHFFFGYGSENNIPKMLDGGNVVNFAWYCLRQCVRTRPCV